MGGQWDHCVGVGFTEWECGIAYGFPWAALLGTLLWAAGEFLGKIVWDCWAPIGLT